MRSTWPAHLFLPTKITFLSNVRENKFGVSFCAERSILPAFRRDLLSPSSGCMLRMWFEQSHTKCIIWHQSVGKRILANTKLQVERVDFGNGKKFSTPGCPFCSFFCPSLFSFFPSFFLSYISSYIKQPQCENLIQNVNTVCPSERQISYTQSIVYCYQ